jgi:Glycerophosphoryl diester phosphodiesterase
VEIIAHRGLALNEVENTLPSFKHALENGADAIELDVHESKDGNVIVFHDFDLRRLFQLDKLTYELSWEELKRLKFPGKDYGIPLLEDVFRQINSKLYVELKTMDESGKRYYPNLVDKVISLASIYGRKDVIISFDPLPLIYGREKWPQYTYGLDMDHVSLTMLGRHNVEFYLKKIGLSLPEVNLLPKLDIYDRSKTIPWVVNDPELFQSLKEKGYPGIISDRADMLNKYR